jgi:hypothetical protein
MKSEHRHELKTNELERIATDWGRASEKYVHEHTAQLVVAIIVVIAAAVGAIYWKTKTASLEHQSWRSLLDAKTAEEFGNVADKYAGTPVGAWARLREAEAEYFSAIRLMFSDGKAGRSEMKKAEEHFEQLVNDKSTPIDALERALFGLARCREALPEENVPAAKINDRAIATYERLVNSKEFADTMYKEIAEARIRALRTGSAQDFYAWFEKQNPKLEDLERPKDVKAPPLPGPPDASGRPLDGKKGATTPDSDRAPDMPPTEPPTKSDPEKSGPAKTGTGGAGSPPAGGPTLPLPPAK